MLVDPSISARHMFFSPSLIVRIATPLRGTAVDNGGLDASADGSAARAKGLEFGNDLQALGIRNLAEDDVFAIEPRSDDGGDEELGAVAGRKEVSK